MAKLKYAAVVSVLKELGMDTADKWPVDRLIKKLGSLEKYMEDEEAKPKTADGKATLKKILSALKNEEEIELTGAPGKEEAAPAKEKAKKAKAEEADEDEDEDSEDDEEGEEETEESEDAEDEEVKKAAKAEKGKKAAKAEKDEDEEDDEDEKPAKKSKKDKKKAKKDKPGKGPGIIATIIELLKKASKKKPITKKEVHQKLTEKFPDRPADSMKNTVNVQIPFFLKSAKGLIVESKELEGGGKGYWLDPDAEPTKGRKAAKKDKKSDKAAKKAKKAAKEESDDEEDED